MADGDTTKQNQLSTILFILEKMNKMNFNQVGQYQLIKYSNSLIYSNYEQINQCTKMMWTEQ